MTDKQLEKLLNETIPTELNLNSIKGGEGKPSKLEFECYTEIFKRMTHNTVHPVHLMIDDETDLYKEIGYLTQEKGVKFKVTLERIK